MGASLAWTYGFEEGREGSLFHRMRLDMEESMRRMSRDEIRARYKEMLAWCEDQWGEGGFDVGSLWYCNRTIDAISLQTESQVAAFKLRWA